MHSDRYWCSLGNWSIAALAAMGRRAGAAGLCLDPGHHQRQQANAMKGCITLLCIGLPLALLGLWLDSERLMALGAGAIAAVVIGWPGLLLLGLLHRSERR